VAFTEGSSDGVSNGTTAVAVVAAPAANVRRIVRLINIYNADSASVTVTTRLNNNGTLRILDKTTLTAGSKLTLTDIWVLDTVDKKIEILLAGAVSATEPDWVTTWAEIS